jgi:glutathione S-transferase
MLTLYIANKNYSSWSLRPWVLMRELGIPFGEQLRPFGRDGTGDFRSFSPSGKVPCLVDGDTVVWDSLAITEYLAATSASYAGRLLDLPSMRAWYEAALAEPWRDEPHDAEARVVGTVLQDLRRPPH